jgi:uncharacterized protein YjiS (DUF1127 family)
MNHQTLTARYPGASCAQSDSPLGAESWQGPSSEVCRHHRSARLHARSFPAMRWLEFVLRRAVTRVRRWLDRRAMHRALRELDPRTLRDLGIDRSEISSVCAEMAGDAEATRILTLRSQSGQPLI